MGFDLSGNSGNYFRSTIWAWYPVVALLEDSGQFSEKTISKISYNTGCKVSKASAVKMAKVLYRVIKSRPEDTNIFVMDDDEIQRDKNPQLIRPEQIGVTKADLGLEEGDQVYSTDVQLIKKFILFLIDSGGFQVF